MNDDEDTLDFIAEEEDAMQWQKCIEKIHRGIKTSEIIPKDRTEKGYYECIIARDDVRDKVKSWLARTKNRKRSSDDAERAKFLREKGNMFFKKKDYSSSVKNYTESARYSTSGNGDFSMAIANRSAAFFHASRYEESLRDIEIAVSCDYPEATLWKLYLRAARCHIELGNGESARREMKKLEKFMEKNGGDMSEEMKNSILRRADDSTRMASERRERRRGESRREAIINPEDMLPKNVEFPFASTSLTRKRCHVRGRYVVAGKSIKKGDVLFVEKPYAWVPVTHGNDVSSCAHCCGSMDDSLVPCRECSDALYCGWACWKDAWPYHRWECAGYRMGLWQQIGISHLAFKIFIVSATTSDLVWFNDAQKLVTNIDKKNINDIAGLAIASLMLTTYMEEYTNFFDSVDIEKCLVEKFSDKSTSLEMDRSSTIEAKKVYVGSMMLRHSLQMLANAYAITKIGESASESSAGERRALYVEEQRRIAAGAYPSASMLNHSCDPTVIHTFWRNWLIVKAVKNIAEGQEIFNCYGPHFKRMPKSERRDQLLSQYCFYCRCEACENPLYDSYTDRFDGLKCPKCSGSSRRIPKSDIQRCYDCGATSSVTFERALETAGKHYEQGIRLTDMEKWEEAIPCFDKCLAIRDKYMYEHNEDIAITLDALGQCHGSNGRWLVSISYLEKSLATIEERYGSDSIEVANELNKITDVCFRYLGGTSNRRTQEYRDNFIKTRKYVDRALEIMSLTSGPWNDGYREVNDKKEHMSLMLRQLRI